MNLDEQLRAALDREAEMQQGPAPDVDRLISGGKVRRRRRNLVRFGVAAALAVVLMAVGLESQRLVSADPAPADPASTVQALGSLGRLAYGIDGDIYVADADGRNPVRVADGAPSEEGFCGGYWGEGAIWSPDGRYLAYRGDGGEAIPSTCDRTVNISDSAGRRVASFPGEGWSIAWSPDSSRVAVWVDFYGDAQLAIYGLDGVRQALLAMPPEWAPPGDVDPVWSPDGASLLVPGGAEVPVDGSTPSQLSVDDPRSHVSARYSPNGAEIAYISPEGLVVAAADGSQARVLVPGRLQDFQGFPWSLVWSPTGDRIAFISQTSGESEETGRRATELAVLDMASGSVVPLADLGGANGLKFIKFSPQGDEILFTRMEAREPSLWSVHVDGSDPHRLVAGTSWGDWQKR